MLISTSVFPVSAQDFNVDGIQASREIQMLKAFGILDDDFKGDQEVSRAEFSTILVRVCGLDEIIISQSFFKDVPNDYKYKEAISTVASSGWLIGNEKGFFRPDEAVTLQEAVKAI